MSCRVWVGLALLLATPLAAAQDYDWSFTPYLWAAGIDGEAGLGPFQTDIGVEFSDIADVLAGAALFHVEANRDGYGVFGDLVFLSLEADSEPSPVGGQTETSFDTTIAEIGYLNKSSSIGLELGVRYWDLDLEMDPTTLPTLERGQDWVDGFVGLRTVREINDKWNWTTRANIGAGGTDVTLGVDMVFGRKLASGNQFVSGFKLLDIDYEEPSANGVPFRMDLMFIGATIGYLFD